MTSSDWNAGKSYYVFVNKYKIPSLGDTSKYSETCPYSHLELMVTKRKLPG
jgi:hypothetical protein